MKVKDGAVVGRMTMDQWNAVIDVNLGGVFLCARSRGARMIELGNGGVIVNISQHFTCRQRWAEQLQCRQGRSRIHGACGVGEGARTRRHPRRCGRALGFTHTEILASMRPEMLDKLNGAGAAQAL